MFQDYNLIPSLTAVENVALPLELDRVRTRAAMAQARAALDEVGLAGLYDRFPDDLSGGQQQRIAIARAVVGERTLILADEPTGALDSETGEHVLALLRARCDAGAAGLLVTHEARHAGWADRVVFLRDGAVVDEAGSTVSPEAFLAGRAAGEALEARAADGPAGPAPAQGRGVAGVRAGRAPGRRRHGGGADVVQHALGRRAGGPLVDGQRRRRGRGQRSDTKVRAKQAPWLPRRRPRRGAP